MEIHWQMLVMLLVATRSLAIVDGRRPREVSTSSARPPSGRRPREVSTSSARPPRDLVNLSPSQGNPKLIFEVTKPIEVPKEKPCSVQLLDHDFAFTYTQPPVRVNYTPPTNCQKNWTKVVMEWKGTCDGNQFDRIAGVWLNGVEILRTSTAEPIELAIEWTIEKDISKYSSLLDKPQILEVWLGNLVNNKYTGIYHVNVTFHFYGDYGKKGLDNSGFADSILPISLPNTQIMGSWFQISSSSDVQSKSLQLPPNTYKAVLEVFVAGQADDEFWYMSSSGNGPFREVVVFIDGVLVGAVWPYPVIFTGGFDPYFWQPVVGIGAFDLPSYEIEVTPFLGKLLDGKEHTFRFGVTNAMNVWYVDANLHLWLDDKSSSVRGQLIGHEEPKLELSFGPNPDGSFHTSANRTISSSGWVESSHGKLITNTSQVFKYDNLKTNYGDVQQTITTNSEVILAAATGIVLSSKVDIVFPFYLDSSHSNIAHAFNKNVSVVSPNGSFFSSLNNTQNIEESMQQIYHYQSTDGCFSWKVNVSNSEIVSNSTDTSCSKTY